MSISVGSMSAGLGLDMSEFQSGMQKATEVARSNSTQMSAAMKQSAREGAESLRLIDEAIGVHVSRPLTRIIGQSQLVGGALASVFALSAGFAIGSVLVEQGKRLLEVTGALEGWKEMLGLVSQSAEDTAKQMGTADEQIIANLKRKTEMQDAYNQLVLGLKGGDFEKAHIELLKQETAEILKQIAAQTALVQARATEEGWRGKTVEVGHAVGGDAMVGLLSAFGISQAKDSMQAQSDANKMAEAMKPLHDALQRLFDEIQKDNWKVFHDGAEASAAAATKAGDEIAALQKEISGLESSADPFVKIAADIEGFHTKAMQNLSDISALAREGLIPESTLDRAEHAFDTLTEKLAQYRAALEATAAAKAAQELFTKPIPGVLTTETSAPGLAPAPTVAPVLGSGGTAGAQFSAFASDQAAQLKAASAAYQDIVTPQQKYSLAQAELNLLLEKGLIDQDAYTAGLQKAEEQMAEASNKMAELQKKTGDASLGMQAFFQQMGAGANNNGTFTFDILSKGLDGFENNTVQALTGGRTAWRKYFEELDQMALKFVLNKTLTQGLKNIFPGLFPSATPPAALAQTGQQPGPGTAGTPAIGALPNILNLPKEAFGAMPSVLNPSQASNTAELDSAGTTLTSAGTMLSSAAAALEAAASTLSSTGVANLGGGGGGAPSFNPLSFTAFGGGLATGGDLTPGTSYMVGEQGPEPLTVDSSGAAFISPHSSLRDSSGGTTHIHNYDLRGADPAVVQRLQAALPMVEERAVARAVASSSEIALRTANR